MFWILTISCRQDLFHSTDKRDDNSLDSLEKLNDEDKNKVPMDS